MVVSGDTVTISVVITDLAGIVMTGAPVGRACTIPVGLGGRLDVPQAMEPEYELENTQPPSHELVTWVVEQFRRI
jgi:hypothetical protein